MSSSRRDPLTTCSTDLLAQGLIWTPQRAAASSRWLFLSFFWPFPSLLLSSAASSSTAPPLHGRPVIQWHGAKRRRSTSRPRRRRASNNCWPSRHSSRCVASQPTARRGRVLSMAAQFLGRGLHVEVKLWACGGWFASAALVAAVSILSWFIDAMPHSSHGGALQDALPAATVRTWQVETGQVRPGQDKRRAATRHSLSAACRAHGDVVGRCRPPTVPFALSPAQNDAGHR